MIIQFKSGFSESANDMLSKNNDRKQWTKKNKFKNKNDEDFFVDPNQKIEDESKPLSKKEKKLRE